MEETKTTHNLTDTLSGGHIAVPMQIPTMSLLFCNTAEAMSAEAHKTTHAHKFAEMSLFSEKKEKSTKPAAYIVSILE